VPHGPARAAAEALATALARFPQACLRSDRRSAYEALDLDLEAALANELRLGTGTLAAEGLAGAERFAQGAGRHGEADAGEAD
jgi:enoyl-CoA hydratase